MAAPAPLPEGSGCPNRLGDLMPDNISFHHGKHLVEVKALQPEGQSAADGTHMRPARIPGLLLMVYVDGLPLGNLPHRELEEPIDTEERARRLVNRKLGRRL